MAKAKRKNRKSKKEEPQKQIRHPNKVTDYKSGSRHHKISR